MNKESTGAHSMQISDGRAEVMMVQQYLRLPKLKPIDLNNDPEITARVKHVLRGGEKLTQFYARVGLGRSQIMQMSKDQIAAFARQAEARQKDEPSSEAFEPRPMPKTFLIESFS